MNTDDNKTMGNAEAKHQRRDDLLSELESIRNLLTENSAKSEENHSNHVAAGHIPVLLPDDSIPTLGMEHRHQEGLTRRSKKPKLNNDENNFPVATHTLLSTTRSREKLVDDVVRSALPRLEAILRELVQEALLQDKLRGGKR